MVRGKAENVEAWNVFGLLLFDFIAWEITWTDLCAKLHNENINDVWTSEWLRELNIDTLCRGFCVWLPAAYLSLKLAAGLMNYNSNQAELGRMYVVTSRQPQTLGTLECRPTSQLVIVLMVTYKFRVETLFYYPPTIAIHFVKTNKNLAV